MIFSKIGFKILFDRQDRVFNRGRIFDAPLRRRQTTLNLGVFEDFLGAFFKKTQVLKTFQQGV
jgi:hypothetical protein